MMAFRAIRTTYSLASLPVPHNIKLNLSAQVRFQRFCDYRYSKKWISSWTCQGRATPRTRRLLPVTDHTQIQNFAALSHFRNMNKAACTLVDSSNIRQFLDSFDTILTDCDGVLWNDNDPIQGSPETIHLLKKMGKRVFYVTNNSGKTQEQYTKKCAHLGFPAEKEDVICTAYTTAQYIKNVLKYTGKVYLVGGPAIAEELKNVGIESIGCGKDDTELEGMSLSAIANLPLDPDVGCVVIGFDCHFNYTKLAKALGYLSNKPGCPFVCTNPDNALPMGVQGRPLPGTGSIVGCVEIAAGRKATICGKPYKPIFEVTHEKHNVEPSRTIMIGDRCNTDMALAHNCGLRGLLVLTGYSSLDEVAQLKASGDSEKLQQVPHYYVPRLGELKTLIEKMSD